MIPFKFEPTTIPMKKPWPTKDAMAQVYAQKMWGGAEHDFYSGEGSHAEEIVQPYVSAISEFLNSFSPSISVCDLGCGDFNVGRQLVSHASHYTAVDIVPELVERNKQLYQAENLSFQCLDIAIDELPSADCALLRQVLQHLSNAEIQNIVQKLSAFKYLIVTEHLPEEPFTPNIDIISGQGIRLKKHSGVDLLAAPFFLKVKSAKQLLVTKPKNHKGVIVTMLYEINQA